MSGEISLTNQFLIAMPTLIDPNFSHTVSYICEHNEEGTMGIIINRPLDICFADLCEQLDIELFDTEVATYPIYYGGPVEKERGFVLHTPLGDWENTLTVTKDVGLTMSKDIIQAIAEGFNPDNPECPRPKQFIVTLGCAGWGEEQIEDEIAENSWLNVPANSDILFHTPIEKRWTAAAALLGIDLQQLSNDVGHA